MHMHMKMWFSCEHFNNSNSFVCIIKFLVAQSYEMLRPSFGDFEFEIDHDYLIVFYFHWARGLGLSSVTLTQRC
jgi:hypothetical protein